jgi:hypothetical protein
VKSNLGTGAPGVGWVGKEVVLAKDDRANGEVHWEIYGDPGLIVETKREILERFQSRGVLCEA